jgi:hypothetical protein
MITRAMTEPPKPAQAIELLAEAEAQSALAELFPHLKLDALRAIQALFPKAVEERDVRPASGAVH